MKIISIEDWRDCIEYSCKKELLIPCFVYKIPIEVAKNKKLNFIEQTILELISIDESLRGDLERLSKTLGFYSDNKVEDKTKIIKLILAKLKALRIDEPKEREENAEITIYQFYQEAYTQKLLPIITSKENEFCFPAKEQYNKNNNFKEISFKKGISSKYFTEAILANGYNKNNPKSPTQQEIIRTFFMHNQENYQGSHTIDFKNLRIETIGYPELIYLHVKLYIPQNNINSIIITNGFTNDFSTHLRKIFEENHQKLLKYFREGTRTDTNKVNESNSQLPFAEKIQRYPTISQLIKNIEEQRNKLDTSETLKESEQAITDITTSLFDLIENIFNILSQGLQDTPSLKDRSLLQSLAKNVGFEISDKANMRIFKIHNNDNLQKYFAKALFYKKDELYEIVRKYPNFIFMLSKLKEFRDGLRHSGKKDTLKKIKIKKLNEYTKTIYDVVSIILKIKRKSTDKNINNDNDYSNINNAYLDLEKEFNIDVMNKLPDELKNNLVEINYYLNEIEFITNKFTVVKEVINNLYSSFEFIIRKIIYTSISTIETIPTKDELLKSIRENFDIGESLYRVSPSMIEIAFKKQGASLGAYMLVYLFYQQSVNIAMIKLIEKIIALRRHGSPTIKDVEKITQDKLLEIKESSFKLIEKIMEEI